MVRRLDYAGFMHFIAHIKQRRDAADDHEFDEFREDLMRELVSDDFGSFWQQLDPPRGMKTSSRVQTLVDMLAVLCVT